MSKSEPTSPDGEHSVGPAERLHPFFLLSGLGGRLRSFAGGYAVIGYLAVSRELSTALYAAVALLLVTAAGIFLYWRRFAFRVGASEIRIDSGIVSRRHRSIPFDRIQDVDVTQGPLARLLGIARVKFETGAASVGPNAEEAILHAVTLQRAHQLRDLVRGHGLAAAGARLDSGEEQVREAIYSMGPRRLFLSGIFNFSLALFAGLFGASQTVGDVIGFDPLSRKFWTGLAAGGEPIAQYLLAHRAGAALAGVILLVVIGMATGIVRTVLRDYGFRLDGTGTGLRRRRGLLTRTDVTLPIKRAQAVVVGTGPIRERFGWSDFHVQSLAQDEGGRGDHLLAPLATADEVGRILDELGWRRLPDDVDWRQVSRSYVTQFAIAISPLLLVVAIQAIFLSPLATAGLVLLAGLVAMRWLGWRRTTYALDGDRLLIRTGWLRRRLLILPTDKIQTADLSQNFIGRWFGIAELRFGVAGAGGFSNHFIPAIPAESARQLRGDLLARLL